MYVDLLACLLTRVCVCGSFRPPLLFVHHFNVWLPSFLSMSRLGTAFSVCDVPSLLLLVCVLGGELRLCFSFCRIVEFWHHLRSFRFVFVLNGPPVSDFAVRLRDVHVALGSCFSHATLDARFVFTCQPPLRHRCESSVACFVCHKLKDAAVHQDKHHCHDDQGFIRLALCPPRLSSSLSSASSSVVVKHPLRPLVRFPCVHRTYHIVFFLSFSIVFYVMSAYSLRNATIASVERLLPHSIVVKRPLPALSTLHFIIFM